MKKAIVFDLDETLISTKKRHYECYKRIVARLSDEMPLLFEDYLTYRIKRASNNALTMKEVHGISPNASTPLWKEWIEQPDLLSLDRAIVHEGLIRETASKYEVIILSLRSNINEAKHQLSLLPFATAIDTAIFVSHHGEKNPKTEHLMTLKQHFEVVAFVGDTTADSQAALHAEINFVGVETGLLPFATPINFITHPTINHYLRALS